MCLFQGFDNVEVREFEGSFLHSIIFLYSNQINIQSITIIS